MAIMHAVGTKSPKSTKSSLTSNTRQKLNYYPTSATT